MLNLFHLLGSFLLLFFSSSVTVSIKNCISSSISAFSELPCTNCLLLSFPIALEASVPCNAATQTENACNFRCGNYQLSLTIVFVIYMIRGLIPRSVMYVSQGALFFASYEFFKRLFSLEVAQFNSRRIQYKESVEDDPTQLQLPLPSCSASQVS
uniref:Uncharacterized protein n=1 Tax=Manihot esculenta TaxID=3983 RepID=A0A2C9WI42_MANES